MSRWHVCFCESRSDRWWKRFLQPGFSHVFAYMVIAEDLSLVVDRTETELNIYHSNAQEPENCVVVEYESQVMPTGLMPNLGTCVSITKHLLGIRDPRIITPWQLYQHLEDHYGSLKAQEA